LVFEELQELFLQAVSLSNNPSDIDSDLQVRRRRLKMIYLFLFLGMSWCIVSFAWRLRQSSRMFQYSRSC
jgi:hypothetical protein